MHTTQTKSSRPGSSPAAQRSMVPTTAAAAQRMPAYARRQVQTKVAVGPANDSFENEADSVAQRVSSGKDVAPESISSVTPAASRAPAEDKKPEAGAKPAQKAAKPDEKKPEAGAKPAQRAAKPDEKKPETAGKPVQKSEAKDSPGTAGQQASTHTPEAAKDGVAHPPAHEAMADAAEQAIEHKGPGRPINPTTLQALSERMKVDLSHVRVHDGPDAQEACRALHARAFTHGCDIWLGAGESDTDVALMAHELTHVVQQADNVYRKSLQGNTDGGNAPPEAAGAKPQSAPIQRAPTTPPSPPASGTSGAPAAGAGKSNVDKTKSPPEVVIPLMSLPKFKADGRKGSPSPYVHKQRMPVKKRPETTQKTKWDAEVRPGVTKAVDDLFKRGGDGAQQFFIPAKAPLPKKMTGKPGQANPKGAQGDFVLIFGSKEDVINESIVPYWERGTGKEHNFDIDHVKEMQLGGNDDPSNYELLDWTANRNSGSGIRNELLKRFGDAILTGGKLDPAFTSAPKMDTLVAQGWAVGVDDFKDDLQMPGLAEGAAFWWSVDDVKQGEHLKIFRPMTDAEITAAGLTGSETELVIFSSSGGGYPRRIPWKLGATGAQPVEMENFYAGFKLEQVTYNPGAGEGASLGSLKGKLFVNGKVFDGQAPTSTAPGEAGTKPKIDFSFGLKQAKGIQHGGFIDDTAILPTLAANVRRAVGLSPIVFEEARLDTSKGLYAAGQIMPSIPLLAGMGIEFVLTGEDVRVQKLFSAGDFALPKPLQMTGGTLLISASTAMGLGAKGDLYFAIDRVGEGHVGVSASTGKSLAEAGFDIEGDFKFDPKLVGGAAVKAWYRRDEAGEYGFGIAGHLDIAEGKIKGVKTAGIDVSYERGKFSADGTAQLTIPGVKQAGLHVEYDEKDGLVIGGDVLLEESKFIASGSGKITVRKKDDDGYHASAAGSAIPKIPGISSAIAFTVDDDAFTVEGTAGYEKGMLKGSITVGATNLPVGEDGKPGGGKPGKQITVYGGGSVSLKLAPWLQATAGIKLKPNGEIEVVGKIGLPSSLKIFDEQKVEKNLFKINIDIPILGISAAGQNIGIFATIGGGLDLSAGFGPGEIQELGVEVTYNPDHEEDTHISGGAKLHIPAHAGLRLFVRGALGVGIPIVDARAGLEIGAELGLEGALDAGVEIDWSPSKGLVLDAKGSIFVEPKLKFDISAFVTVDLDLLFTTVNLYEHRWQLAAFEWGSGLRFGVEFPVHYEEGKPFNVSLDDLKFTVPEIDPMETLGGLVKHIVG